MMEAEVDPECNKKAAFFRIPHAMKISTIIGYLVPWPLHYFHFPLYNHIEMKTCSQSPEYLPYYMKSLKPTKFRQFMEKMIDR